MIEKFYFNILQNVIWIQRLNRIRIQFINMDRKILVLSIITIAIVACGCLTAVYLFTGEHNDNKADDINESNEMNKTANITEDYVSESVVEESSTYEDPHPDWVCEGDSWYSVQIGDGN